MTESRVPQHDPNYTTNTGVYFYTARFYALDSFSAFTVDIWDKVFLTAEHAYQWRKYSESNPEVAEKILAAQNPHDANKNGFVDSWHDEKLERMKEILRAKLARHEKVQALLLETGERDICENSAVDYFWGIGADGSGENQLGKLWMKLRAELVEA